MSARESMPTSTELCDLAVRYHQQGNLDHAEQLYRQVISIDPDNANAHANLGVALLTRGRKQEAIDYFRQAIRINPRHVIAYNNLANALLAKDQIEEAVSCFRQAVLIDPGYANAHYNLGNILRDQGRPEEAIACYRDALRANPDHADAHNNLGNLLYEKGYLAEAAECYRAVLRLSPAYANIHNNLGVALRDQGDLAGAADCFHQALASDKNNVDAHVNLAVLYDRLGRRDEAWEQYQQALQINPGHEITLWNRSLMRLQKGDFEGGWQDYEYRWAQPAKVSRSFDKPRWRGEPLGGKTILVHAEQGLGDTIQFARYLPMVGARGGRVVFECPAPLLGLFTGIPGVDELVQAGTPLPSFDVQVPHLSLPGVFGTTLATVPPNISALNIQPAAREKWRRQVEAVKGLKIGIVWQGNPRNPGDARRSVALTRFEALARVPGASLVSLQVGKGTEQLAAASFPILDIGTRFHPDTLDDLAATLVNLDLFITVETGAAHLAGALGVPVWNLLSYNPCWRWLLDRLDSPWYPSMRLFRQHQLGDWDQVFADVVAALQVTINAH